MKNHKGLFIAIVSGVGCLLLGEIAVILNVSSLKVWATPLCWTGYILLVDSYLFYKRGTSLIQRHPRHVLLTIPTSCGLWVIFEGYNLLLKNWEYLNVPSHPLVAGVGYFWSFGTILPRYPYEVSLEALGLKGEEVTFQSQDGLKLSGTLIVKDTSNPLIILCHGVGANRYDLVETARALYEEGHFNLFLFDFRAHGRSGGWLTSFGYREQKDLLGVLHYLDSRENLVHQYGVFGVSMGGVVGIMVAAQDERIQALCVDSPFADLEETMKKHLQLIYPFPEFPFFTFTKFSYNLLFMTDLRNVSPLRVVKNISPRPFYLINGGKDERMTPERAKAIYERAAEPKTLWIVPGAGHLEGRAIAAEEYDRSIVSFFSNALGKKNP